MAFNSKMHERNIYKTPPDFNQIAIQYPLFSQYIITNVKGKTRVDFSNTEALRMLTTILLKKDFNLDVEIPEKYLIPTIPQRLNYILWVEDLLLNVSQTNESISGVDIGTGPCAIFSLLGAQKNGWKFIATESSDNAIEWAKKNIEKNNLQSKIIVVKVNEDSILKEVLSDTKVNFEFCLCNPPFFENAEEIRKKHLNSKETIVDITQEREIFVKGGEAEFVRNMLKDSLIFKDRICLFSSMFGKKSSFLEILQEIKCIKDVKVTTTEFCQGNTVRWGIVWTFDSTVKFKEEEKKEKPRKPKPPLQYRIHITNSKDFTIDPYQEKAVNILKSLEIPMTIEKSYKGFVQFLLKSDTNTWTHQRRKRRQLERQNKMAGTSKEDTERNSDKCVNVADGNTFDNKIIKPANSSLGCVDTLKEKSMSSSISDVDTPISKEEIKIEELSEKGDLVNSESDKTSLSIKRKIEFEDEHFDVKKAKLNEERPTDIVHGKLLNCHLQLVKARDFVYVKMFCSPEANRSTMYQVFQLIKNKLN